MMTIGIPKAEKPLKPLTKRGKYLAGKRFYEYVRQSNGCSSWPLFRDLSEAQKKDYIKTAIAP